MGVRSLLAGLCLYLWARLRSDERRTLEHWRAAAVVGVMLFLGCHGLLAWAQQRVPSGVAALGMATLPLWMTLLDWLWAGAHRPGLPVWLGLVLGLLGLAVLGRARHSGGGDERSRDPRPAGERVRLGSGVGEGTTMRLPTSVVMSTGMQLIAGGAALALVSLVSGEVTRFNPAAVSMRSVHRLCLHGGRGVDPRVHRLRLAAASLHAVAGVASYAFVNPLVAVVLGAAVGGEPLNARTALAAVLILAAVAAILSGRRPLPPPALPALGQPRDRGGDQGRGVLAGGGAEQLVVVHRLAVGPVGDAPDHQARARRTGGTPGRRLRLPFRRRRRRGWRAARRAGRRPTRTRRR